MNNPLPYRSGFDSDDGSSNVVRFDRQPPYVITFHTDSQLFIFIGSSHQHNPVHPENGIIKLYYWARLLEKHEKSNIVAMAEGGTHDTRRYESEQEAIYHRGEHGLLIWLAEQDGVECISPEPDYVEEMKCLRKEFDLEAIFHYFFMRTVSQWHRLDPRPGFSDYFSFIPKMPTRYGVEEYDLDLDKIKAIHQQITGTEFDKEDKDSAYHLSNPYEGTAVTNRVSMASMRFRDEHIAQEIKRYWEAGRNIFAVYGHSHVEEQEEKLKELLR